MFEKDARTQIEKVVNEWFIAQYRDPFLHFHLYIKPAPNAILLIAQKAPVGFELANNQRISPSWTREQARAKIYDWAARLPVIG